MKNLLFVFLLFFYVTSVFSQDFEDKPTSEFGNSKEELIYSKQTISQLKYIVDSLNLKYAICDLNKTYLSNYQAKTNFVTVQRGNFDKMRQDMDSNISYSDFIKKYATKEQGKNALLVKYSYKDYQDNDRVKFATMGLGEEQTNSIVFEEELENYEGENLKNRKWIYKHYSKTDYEKESISAFYILNTNGAVPLKEKYAKMIQYADCMVDTTEQIFYKKAYESGVHYGSNEDSKVSQFLEYINSKTNKPKYKDYEDYKDFYKVDSIWASLLVENIEKLRSKDSKFDDLLKEAVEEAKIDGGSNDDFEYYVGTYHSKETELELKRGRRVIGGCSQDLSPRYHALSIAKLSAETVKWDIFLRAHLDIMNDRFERASDGSYAWEKRQTYIKELEVLDINVLDLLLGITLRTENPSQNHYYGSMSRTGRALAETQNPGKLETKMLDMIADNELDTYNRILIYYLFTHYNYNLRDKNRITANEKKLQEAIKKLPKDISEKIQKDK